MTSRLLSYSDHATLRCEDQIKRRIEQTRPDQAETSHIWNNKTPDSKTDYISLQLLIIPCGLFAGPINVTFLVWEFLTRRV